jgi:hypothetical protein
MGGQPKSEASSLSSPDVRALWEEPTEAIPKNQRDQAVGIHSLKGLEDVKSATPLFRRLEVLGGNRFTAAAAATWALCIRARYFHSVDSLGM